MPQTTHNGITMGGNLRRCGVRVHGVVPRAGDVVVVLAAVPGDDDTSLPLLLLLLFSFESPPPQLVSRKGKSASGMPVTHVHAAYLLRSRYHRYEYTKSLWHQCWGMVIVPV